MASIITLHTLPWIILIVLLTFKVFQVLCDHSGPLDTAPNELGLQGKPTASAKYGWNLILRDINKSWQVTRLYQAAHKDTASQVHKAKQQSKNYYSPKRSSKCLFGTPQPEYHCGPDIVAKIFTREYMKYAFTLWKPYVKTRTRLYYR